MDLFLFTAVFLKMFFFSLGMAYYGEFVYIWPILGYALYMELLKYTVALMMAFDSSPVKEDTSDDMDKNRLMKQASIPKVKSHTIWLFCQALDLTAEMNIDDNAQNMLPLEMIVIKQKVPIVYSPTVWSYCKMIGIEAKLEFPTNAQILKAGELPVVTSKEVHLFCEALGLGSKMAL